MRLTLEEWRRAKNKSQREMAEICNVHMNTYRIWEENSSKIEIGKFVVIANALEVNIDDIILT